MPRAYEPCLMLALCNTRGCLVQTCRPWSTTSRQPPTNSLREGITSEREARPSELLRSAPHGLAESIRPARIKAGSRPGSSGKAGPDSEAERPAGFQSGKAGSSLKRESPGPGTKAGSVALRQAGDHLAAEQRSHTGTSRATLRHTGWCFGGRKPAVVAHWGTSCSFCQPTPGRNRCGAAFPAGLLIDCRAGLGLEKAQVCGDCVGF
jgi:hypothetical protein